MDSRTGRAARRSRPPETEPAGLGPRPGSAWAALILTLAVGCDIYEPGPYLALLDASADGSEPALVLADHCSSGEVPPMPNSVREQVVSLDGLADDERVLSGCNGMGLSGPDGFVSLPSVAEQRWSLRAEPLDRATDVVMYVMPACDPASCSHLLDRCGPGIPESHVFQAPAEGDYLLGIDSRGGGGEVELTLVSAQCGDRKRDLGEGCDDGNRMDGDGCDRECRLEIAPEMNREIEPNDGPTEANVVLTGAERSVYAVVGRVGGACDVDVFVVRLVEQADVHAVMLNGAELPCDGSVPTVEMQLINPDGQTRRGSGETGGLGGRCPSIEAGAAFAEGLEPGSYFLSIAAERDVATVDYNLQIEIVPTG